MNSNIFANKIRQNLQKSGVRAELVSSLIAQVLASDEPLAVAIDHALTSYECNISDHSQLSIEVAIRIEALQEIFAKEGTSLTTIQAHAGIPLASSLGCLIASAPMIETSEGFTFDMRLLQEIQRVVYMYKG